jgi:hypothetical protein
MTKEMHMKRVRLFAVLMILVTGLSLGQTKRFQLTLFGGANRVFAYGSTDDYLAGSNDFPVTPAHTPTSFGGSLTYFLGGRLGIELRGEYALASSLSLTDPSDQDTVSIKSAKRMAASLNAVWELSAGRLRPYLVFGGGVDKISGDLVYAVSGYGYDVTFAPPDKTLSLFANAGAGLRWMASASLGAQVDVRYRALFGDPGMIHNLNASAGIFWKF